MYNVIAITREFGSLGRQIAKFVAEKMNYDYYDRDIIDKIAEDFDVGIKELTTNESKFGKGIYGKMMYPLGTGGYEKQERLYDSERKVIEYLAMRKNCVIVGRCADYILKQAGNCNVFSVFIYAPYSARYSNGLNNFGLTSEALMECMDKVDGARELFYKRHTGEAFNSIKYRDLMIDSSIANPSGIADMICYCAEVRFRENR